MSAGLNDDFTVAASADTATMDWQPSPSPTVWRKRLELSGPSEAGRVTSVVCYEPGSSFHAHPHPDGEEILVLEGVFSDESGYYPAGSYLLNPEGFEHAPGSVGGCVLFVKLRQYPGTDRRHVALRADDVDWRPGAAEGIALKPLYGEASHPETMALVRLDPGTALPLADGGNELFVIEGRLDGEHDALGPGAWLRLPPGDDRAPVARETAVLYLKNGHLSGV